MLLLVKLVISSTQLMEMTMVTSARVVVDVEVARTSTTLRLMLRMMKKLMLFQKVEMMIMTKKNWTLSRNRRKKKN